MREYLCIQSFHEDGYEFWSEGNYYSGVMDENGALIIENNFGGTGIIYPEDVWDYFE